jgi:chaperonin GroEL (HSP60 family)
VAVINVGAATKTKMKEKKDRVEDVLNTTRAAVEEGTGSFGFNAETGIYEDLMQAGIVDPTKLSRLALQHAASAPGLFMTTEAVIAEKPKKKEICGT